MSTQGLERLAKLQISRNRKPTKAESRARAPVNGRQSYLAEIRASFDVLAGSVVLDDKQVQAISGYSVSSLKTWRQRGTGGPEYFWINGRPRTTVANVRTWLATLQAGK